MAMDRDVRFHHVLQDLRIIEARQCARHWVLFHETYTIALLGRARAGMATWRYRHRSFFVGSDNQVMAIQPGELHATLKQTPCWDFIGLHIGEGLMKTIAAELGWPSPALNVALASAGSTHPEMVRALTGFGATLCTTLYADLEHPGQIGMCTCARQAGPILEALADVVRAFLDRYAEGAAEIAQPRRGAAVLRKAKEYLHAHYQDAYSLDRVATASGCGKYYLAHLFKREFGVSPWQYHARVLISKTCDALIRLPDRPLAEVAREVGWPSKVSVGTPPERAAVMIRNFRRVFGTTPDRFRASLRRSAERKLLQDLAQGFLGDGAGVGGFVGQRAGEGRDHVLRGGAVEAD
jgi:AraC-like DNA-binding protein